MKKLVSVLLTLAVVLGLSLTMAVPVAAAYSYSETWGTSPNTVDVVVEDTGDGWLQWTYTYPESPTHTPKMTVAINYPNGFAITTFDDGEHDGWYYAPDPDVEATRVRFADYSGGTYTNWAITTASGNVLTVKIKKSALGHTFMWHGYANVNGNSVWIETDENWLPTAEVTLEDLAAVGLTAETYNITAINVEPGSIAFGPVNPGDIVSGDNITVENIGGVTVIVDAYLDPMTGTVFNYLRLNGAYSGLYTGGSKYNGYWNDIISSLLPSRNGVLTTELDVPETYSGQGSEAATLIFEATPV